MGAAQKGEDMSVYTRRMLQLLRVIWYNNVNAVEVSAKELLTGLTVAMVMLYGVATFMLLLFATFDTTWPLFVGLAFSGVISLLFVGRIVLIRQIVDTVGSGWGLGNTTEKAEKFLLNLVLSILVFYWLALIMPLDGTTWIQFLILYGILLLASYIFSWKLVWFEKIVFWGLIINILILFAIPILKKADQHAWWNFAAKIERWRAQQLSEYRASGQKEVLLRQDVARCQIIKQHRLDPGNQLNNQLDYEQWKNNWNAYYNANSANWKKLSGDELVSMLWRCEQSHRKGVRLEQVQALRTSGDMLQIIPGYRNREVFEPGHRPGMVCTCKGANSPCDMAAYVSVAKVVDWRSARNNTPLCQDTTSNYYKRECGGSKAERMARWQYICGEDTTETIRVRRRRTRRRRQMRVRSRAKRQKIAQEMQQVCRSESTSTRQSACQQEVSRVSRLRTAKSCMKHMQRYCEKRERACESALTKSAFNRDTLAAMMSAKWDISGMVVMVERVNSQGRNVTTRMRWHCPYDDIEKMREQLKNWGHTNLP